MNEVIFLVNDSPEGGYEARALGHAIFTEADTLNELHPMIQDAIMVHFDEAERPETCCVLIETRFQCRQSM